MLQDVEQFDVDAAFEDGMMKARHLWSRMGAVPLFDDKRVLEIGSGLGSLSTSIALAGAKTVLGVDIWEPRVAFANKKVRERFPELRNVSFVSTPVEQLEPADPFDLIVSQNTFEHIADIDAVLAALRRLLAPGGRAYIGFSPLYHSPFGDHGELRAPVRFPWLHLLAGRKQVIASYNRANREAATTLAQCGYNGHKPATFREAFHRSGLIVEQIRVNPAEGRLKSAAMAGFKAIARIPRLEPYLTVGMYVILRQPHVLA
jgi:ubiquinone/menaquinone biosynthesis C-methylase UbiE